MAQLVQLIESSLFNNIRILLMEPLENIYLVKTLYGILMILPQGKAFNALSKRLKNIEMLINMDERKGIRQPKEKNLSEFLDEFDSIHGIKKDLV